MFEDELLVRVGREYHLTALASELREPLQELIHLAEETVQKRPHFYPARDRRLFSLVASDYAAYMLLQPLVQRLTREAPGISLQIRADSRGEHLKSTSDLNLGLFPSPDPADVALPHEVLLRDRWVCAVWRGNRRVGDTISLDQYVDLPHVVYGRGFNEIGSMAERAVRQIAGERHVQASAEGFFLLPFMLCETDLVAFIHERLGRKLADAAEIRLVEPQFETPPITEAMYWNTRNSSDPAHVWLRHQLREISAGL
jgi:DNA-binding transcriptional LysR family regulator